MIFYVCCSQLSLRYWNSHALVNLAISAKSQKDGTLQDVKIAVGSPTLFRESGGIAFPPPLVDVVPENQ